MAYLPGQRYGIPVQQLTAHLRSGSPKVLSLAYEEMVYPFACIWHTARPYGPAGS